MTASNLSKDLDTAFERLEQALQSREQSRRTAVNKSEEVETLRQKLAESEAREQELSAQVESAEKARAAALEKLEETIDKVDRLIASAGETANEEAE